LKNGLRVIVLESHRVPAGHLLGHLPTKGREYQRRWCATRRAKYIDLNHLQVVAVGDASKTREVLAKFGSVEEYDSDGKPVRTAAKTQ